MNTKIKLPVDSNGEPDWIYMEDYMKNLETTVSSSLTKLESAKDSERKKIDTNSWGEFRLGKLLDLKTKKQKEPVFSILLILLLITEKILKKLMKIFLMA